MKKLLLRTLGLTAIVLLSNLPVARAAEGDCHIYCCADGYTYDGPLPAQYSSCCEFFGARCGFFGNASYELHGWINYCPFYETC